jgi:predicted alpha/beta-hydrolase family hydrolase
LLLAPGASAGRDQPSLVAIDAAVTAQGGVVVRMDFPRGPSGKPLTGPAPRLVRAVVEQAESLAGDADLPADRIFLGGRSMGGRMASMAVAEGHPAAGLILLSYPLHPPGRPDKARTDHLSAIRVPSLWVSGTRDAFGTPDELTAAVRALAHPAVQVWVEGADHGMRGKDAVVAAAVAEWISQEVRDWP